MLRVGNGPVLSVGGLRDSSESQDHSVREARERVARGHVAQLARSEEVGS